MDYAEELKSLRDQNEILKSECYKCIEFVAFMVYMVESEVVQSDGETVPWEELTNEDKTKANKMATDFYLEFLNRKEH